MPETLSSLFGSRSESVAITFKCRQISGVDVFNALDWLSRIEIVVVESLIDKINLVFLNALVIHYFVSVEPFSGYVQSR